MGIIELIFVGFSLAMDAFSVALCKGLAIRKFSYKKALIIGFYFGLFQSIMPFLGFLLSENISEHIINIGHFIVFLLFSLIGINMILESRKNKCDISDDISFKKMILLSLATSIDAFAVGIGFAILEINIYFAVLLIGILTFLLSFIAVKIGSLFGNKLENKAELLGGIILIILALKILLEHI